ncbi:MAG: putative proteinB [Candidatus Saccharibacteria bacterium]|nr:putative proteinB [Candidatus Saccharibacteria bacterium]
MLEVICIRHGEAESNLSSLERGVVGSDLPLTEKGEWQARSAAEYLERLSLDGRIGSIPTTIYTSPYHRTRQTAEIIAKALSRHVIVDYRLKEFQKGAWHGMRVADVVRMEEAVPNVRRPEFRSPEGENWFDVANRMSALIDELEAQHESTIILVSHNHPIEMLIGHLLGKDVHEWETRPVTNGSITRIYKTDSLWHIDSEIYNYPYVMYRRPSLRANRPTR